MIQIKYRGHYEILSSNNNKKVLVFNNRDVYVWGEDGELASHKSSKHSGNISQEGNYRLYNVKDEGAYTEGLHLELQTGCGCWENYLLSNDLFNKNGDKAMLLSTNEKITVTSNCCKHCSSS